MKIIFLIIGMWQLLQKSFCCFRFCKFFRKFPQYRCADPYCLRVYRPDGSQVFETTFSYQYTGFDIDGDLVTLYNDNSCCVYNMAGTEKFSGSFDFTVTKVLSGRFPGTLLVLGTQKIEEIRLK